MNRTLIIFVVSALFASAWAQATLPAASPGCHWTGCHSVRHASACPAALVAQDENSSGCPPDHKRMLCCQPGDASGGSPPPLPPVDKPGAGGNPNPPPPNRPNPPPPTRPNPPPPGIGQPNRCQDYTYQQCVNQCQSLRG